MEEEISQESNNPLPEDDDDDAVVSSITVFSEQKSKMVGLSNVMNKVKDALAGRYKVIALTGMAGIGKTAVAVEIFDDPSICSRFEPRVWVKVGKNYQYDKIARDVLAQLDPDMSRSCVREGDERRALREILKDKTWLIVLDDVWDNSVWRYLCDSVPFGNISRPRILITTRLHEVIYGIDIISMSFLNKDESWDLLRERVFGEDSWPPQLERAGKKIAEKCDGLPLMIIAVAGILAKAEKTEEYWDKVASDKQNSVFTDANDAILKLINLWIAERFIEPDLIQTLRQALEELYFNSLVIVSQWASSWFLRFSSHHHHSCSCHGCNGKVWSVKARYIKSCRLQSSLLHMCNREAGKTKFFHVLDRYDADGLEESTKGQRRLCIHNNMLLGIKDLRDTIEFNCAFTASSLLCYGPYQQYEVPICFGLRLLRVLDALTIRFYEFPVEVLEQVQLRYLALTYNGDLPSFISKLLNLQFLIINRHMSIKYCGALAYVPVEIWDMKELKHIQIMGKDLPNPLCRASSLKNLSTLLSVSVHSLNERVLEGIPNLTKLGIQIELAPDDDGKFLNCFDRISSLNKLESLKCVIMNPELRFVAPPPLALSMFPSSLKKLHLSGLGYSWEYIRVIGLLPNLEALKLRCYAFRGQKWKIENKRFLRLRSLVIEDTDLVQLIVECGSLRLIEFVTIKHCYKLKKLNWEADNYPMDIKVVACIGLAEEEIYRIKRRKPSISVFIE
ncbi:hypothetical protein C2S51_003484 [Perilla frutescens var. frutescens]|nr:hypothetical protein C2S51_003484 [Perilla frutescens var. frutescens]